MAGPNPFEGMEEKENPFAGMEEDGPAVASPPERKQVMGARGVGGTIMELLRLETDAAARPPVGEATAQIIPGDATRGPRISPFQPSPAGMAQALGIRVGEFPSRAGPGFFQDELAGYRQLYPEYEFEEVGSRLFPTTEEMRLAGVPRGLASTGPLAGKIVFRKRPEVGGIAEPWTTLSQPGTVTMGDIRSMAGSVPQTAGAIAGTLIGARFGGAPGAVVGAGLGGAAGELGRQEIGQQVFGAPNLAASARVWEATKSGVTEAAMAQLGNYADKAYRFFRSAGVPIQSIPTADFKRLQAELADIIGEDAAKLLTAGDVMASETPGAFLAAIEKKIAERGSAGGLDIASMFLKRQREKEELLMRRLEDITGAQLPSAADAETVMRAVDERLALMGMPKTDEITNLQRQLAQLQQDVPALKDRAAIAKLDEIIQASGGVPRSEAATAEEVGRALSNAVGPVARQEVERVGKIVHPDLAVGAEAKSAADRAFKRSVERAQDVMEEAKLYGGMAGEMVPEATIGALTRWATQIERDIIPALSATDRKVVESALAVLVDEKGKPKRSVSYDDLIATSSNLKAAIRSGFTKEWNVNLEMMSDLEEAIFQDTIKLLPRNLAEQLVDANTIYRSQKQAYRQAGLDKFLQRASGGADYLTNSAAAGRIFNNVDTSTALSRLLTKPEDRGTREIIKGGLLWDLDQRFIDTKGNVNTNGLSRWIADNEVILRSWFTPDELTKIRNLETFTERRVGLGLKPGDTYDAWFGRFWDMPAERAQEAVAAIRRRLPKEDAEKLVGQVKSLANARLRRDYVTFNDEGEQTFKHAKFFTDLGNGRADWIARAIDPGFGTRLRDMATFLRQENTRFASDIQRLQQEILSAEKRLANDKAAAEAFNEVAKQQRAAFSFSAGSKPSDYARLADNILAEANNTSAKSIVSYLEKQAPELLPDFRRSMLAAFYRSVTKPSEAGIGAATGGRDAALNVEKLFDFANDPASMEFMQTILGRGTDAKKAIGDLAKTGAILNPRAQKAVITDQQNPATIALKAFEAGKRVVFGVLSTEARLANSLIRWQNGVLQDRAARALLDPEEFGRLVRIGHRTNADIGAATAAGVGLFSETMQDIFADFEPGKGRGREDIARGAGSMARNTGSWLYNQVTK